MTDDDIERDMPCGLAWLGGIPHRGTVTDVERSDTGRVTAIEVRDETTGDTKWYDRLKQRGRLFEERTPHSHWARFHARRFADPSMAPAAGGGWQEVA